MNGTVPPKALSKKPLVFMVRPRIVLEGTSRNCKKADKCKKA